MNNSQMLIAVVCCLLAAVSFSLPVDTLSPEELERLTALAEKELQLREQPETYPDEDSLPTNKRAQTFVRFGKRAQTFVRFGKRAQTFVRFG